MMTRYRLNAPTLGVIADGEERPVPITIPPSALVSVDDQKDATPPGIDPECGSRFLAVQWEDKRIWVFAEDISERSECVNGQILNSGSAEFR